MTDEHGTALGSAHARFVESLPERGRELRELVDALAPAPSDERVAEQLRRRLHALLASAQLFQEDVLLAQLKPVVERLDAARDGYRAVSGDELGLVRGLCEVLDPDAPDAQVPGPIRTPSRIERWSSARIERGDRVSGSDPAFLAQTVAGGMIAPEVIAALLVASPEVEAEVRAALPAEFCEVTSTAEADTAQLVIDHVSPDLVMIETSLLHEDTESIVRVLRGERRAVVALVPELASEAEAQLGRAWADAVLRLPLPRAGLLERLQRLAGRGARAQSALEQLQAGTVEEIARTVGDEVRRGIAAALRSGRSERIELGDKTELLAATWSAVARIRAHLADRAEGRVAFEATPFAGAPFSLALTDDEPAAPYVGLSESLAGRRIVIVDDDPSVVWFFAGLVREAGAIAIETRSGREALALMRKRTPDLLVSDILMPDIDGFGLCRELRRDAALCHVPIVLLSWKEDFLQRMRELDAGASGYLRKEAGTHQILSTLAEAVRPRAALATLLAGEGEVHGRIDQLGVETLLLTVAAKRPNARVRVRDAWNLFEIDVRDGTRLSVTRTAADGSFARGRPALLQLLGVDVGRFAVTDAEGPLRGELGEPLDRALHEGLAELGGLLDALSDTLLLQVTRVDLDDDVLGPLLAATPTALADLVNRLRTGASPNELMRMGVVGARELEQQLRELARRGAILRVWGEDGQDLALAAFRARQEHPGELLHGVEHVTSHRQPPPLAARASDAGSAQGEARRSERPSRSTRSRPPPMPPRPSRSAPPPPLRRSIRGRSSGSVPPPPPLPSRSPVPPPPSAAEPGADALLVDADAPVAAEPSVAVVLDPATEAAASSVPPALPSARLHVRWRTWSLWTLFLSIAAAVGFFWYSWLARHPIRSTPTAVPAGQGQTSSARVSVPGPVSVGAVEPRPEPNAQPDDPEPQRQTTDLDAIEVSPGYGRVLPFIDRSRGVEVAPGQGLLVVEHQGGDAAPRVRVAGRELGQAPVATALVPGRHELVLRRGGQTSFRYVVIRAGETRIVDGH